MFPGPIFLFFFSSFPLLTLFLTFVLSFSPTSAGVPVTTPFLSRRFCFSGCCMYVYWRDLYLLFRFSFISLKSTANCCGFGTWLLSIYRKVVSSPPPCRYLLACSSSINRSNVFHYFTPAIFFLFGKLVTLTTAVLLIIPHVILQSHYTSYDYWDVLASYQSLPPTTSL